MGLTFYGADSRADIALTTPYADLPTEVAEFLYERRGHCPEQAALFWELDPYGDAEFRGGELDALVQRCTVLLELPWDVPRWEAGTLEEFLTFLRGLRALCLAAIQRGGAVLMLGD